MDSSALLNWFDSAARPFLAEHAPERLPALDDDRRRLQALIEHRDGVTVCVLGNSGIGKSTLLNALAAGGDFVLPAGGVGPLTAQATAVRYSELPSLSVQYHPKAHLWQLAFALERRLEHDLKREKSRSGGATDIFDSDDSEELGRELDPESRRDALERAGVAPKGAIEVDGEPRNDSSMEQLVKQARLIVTGDQFSSRGLPYLVDALRVACEVNARWGAEIEADDARRIVRLRAVLKLAQQGTRHRRRQAGDGHDFMADLRDHAAGFLAPMIESITVGWPSELLRSGITLVDLPGIGIANDTYREITRRFVKDEARAVILVVDRAGPTEATIELLRSSGYWDRLVGSTDNPEADPCNLLLAVTRVDDVAWTARTNWPSDAGPKPSRSEIFARTVEEFRIRMRSQVAEQMSQIGTSTNETVQEARERARRQILDNLEIHPVSAPEFAKLERDDEDDHPLLKRHEETGIPRLRASLEAISSADRLRWKGLAQTNAERLLNATLSELKIVRSHIRAEGQAKKAQQQLQTNLAQFVKPRQEEYDRRVGGFREFLDSTVPTRIDKLVAEAREAAESEVRSYLNALRSAHWSTLRATVRRGGTYHGTRQVTLPDDIVDRFQEPMAAVWSLKLLVDVRRRTDELSTDVQKLVREISSWAIENYPGELNRDLLASQQSRVASLSEQLGQVGKDAAEHMRQVVKSRLGDAIRPAIRDACNNFVRSGQAIGPGVKARILELFNDLAISTMKAAEGPARRILQDCFTPVREEIRAVFNQIGHPVADTADMISGASSTSTTPERAAENAAVAISVEAVLRSCPIDPNPNSLGEPELSDGVGAIVDRGEAYEARRSTRSAHDACPT